MREEEVGRAVNKKSYLHNHLEKIIYLTYKPQDQTIILLISSFTPLLKYHLLLNTYFTFICVYMYMYTCVQVPIETRDSIRFPKTKSTEVVSHW